MTSPAPNVPQTSPGPTAPGSSWFPNSRQVLSVLAIYFCVQIISRTLVSSSVDLDEAEAVVLAQTFSLGYGSEPPLYTWLQIPVFAILGENVFALSLLKNALLFCTYLFTFLTARLMTRNTAAACAACLSLLFLPTIAWESQRDLSHSVLSCTLSVATLLTFVKIYTVRTTRWFVAFGACAGLGLISKFNYALWATGLILAGLSLAEFRSAVLDKRMLLSAVIALGIFLPTGLWMVQHRELALLTSSKFEIQQAVSWTASTRLGLKNLAQSIISFAGPIGAIYLLLFARNRPSGQVATGKEYCKLMLRAWLCVAAILVLVILFGRVTGFKERWFQPILVTLPIFMVMSVERRLSAVRFRILAALALLVIVAVALIMPGRLFLAERLKREEPLERPYRAIASQIRPLLEPGTMLVCDTRLLAGNLRLGIPGVRAFPPELDSIFKPLDSHCFLVWDARKSIEMPENLVKWIATNEYKEMHLRQAQFFQAPYFYHHGKEFRVGLLRLY